MSAFASARNSMMAGSCNPRSMFQSTMRMELRGQVNQRTGAKFSAMISCDDTSKPSRGKLWEDAFLGESEVERIVNLGPEQTVCAGEPDPNSFVCEFLHSNVEKFFDPPSRNDITHFAKESFLDGVTENSNPNIGAAELLSGYSLAHAEHTVVGNCDFHCFFPPQWIDNHRNRSHGPHSRDKNPGIEYHVCIQADKRVAAEPFEREPERIDIVR